MQFYIALQPLVALIAGILIIMIPRLFKLYRRSVFNCHGYFGADPRLK
jgi:hypothetical protein